METIASAAYAFKLEIAAEVKLRDAVSVAAKPYKLLVVAQVYSRNFVAFALFRVCKVGELEAVQLRQL